MGGGGQGQRRGGRRSKIPIRLGGINEPVTFMYKRHCAPFPILNPRTQGCSHSRPPRAPPAPVQSLRGAPRAALYNAHTRPHPAKAPPAPRRRAPTLHAAGHPHTPGAQRNHPSRAQLGPQQHPHARGTPEQALLCSPGEGSPSRATPGTNTGKLRLEALPRPRQTPVAPQHPASSVRPPSSLHRRHSRDPPPSTTRGSAAEPSTPAPHQPGPSPAPPTGP